MEDGQGSIYNIEMQTASNRNIPKRMRYYQGMIDLSILEKGGDYRSLKRSMVIFVCTFDLFGKGRHVYTFENRCIQELGLGLGDDTVKIILNTKGTEDDVSPEMKRLLDFIGRNRQMTLQKIWQKRCNQSGKMRNGGAKRPVDVCLAGTGTEWRRII